MSLLFRKVIGIGIFLGFAAGLLLGRSWVVPEMNRLAEQGFSLRFTEAEISMFCYGLAGISVLFALACLLFYKEK